MTKEKFLAKINIVLGSGNCWECKTTGKFRYGSVSINGKFMKAHRYSWEIHNGPIPKGLWVLHHCDNPACVNPEHLFLGTRSDNMKDCYAKGRSKNTFPKKKHN